MHGGARSYVDIFWVVVVVAERGSGAGMNLLLQRYRGVLGWGCWRCWCCGSGCLSVCRERERAGGRAGEHNTVLRTEKDGETGSAGVNTYRGVVLWRHDVKMLFIVEGKREGFTEGIKGTVLIRWRVVMPASCVRGCIHILGNPLSFSLSSLTSGGTEAKQYDKTEVIIVCSLCYTYTW